MHEDIPQLVVPQQVLLDLDDDLVNNLTDLQIMNPVNIIQKPNNQQIINEKHDIKVLDLNIMDA